MNQSAQKVQSRLVITSYDAKQNPETVKQDSNLAKIIGYIPGEVVATYLGVSSLLGGLTLTANGRIVAQWAFAVLFLLATPIYMLVLPKDETQERPSVIFNANYAMIAFAVWVFALGGPFQACCSLAVENGVIVSGWWQPGWGGILILLVTFLSPVVEKLYFRIFFPKVMKAQKSQQLSAH